MLETRSTLARNVDAELERIITELSRAQQKRRADTRRRLRRHIVALLKQQGFSVGDIFPPLRHARGGKRAI
ncbi:MAG: hypothetical protein M3361_12030 [Candidatus Tectomicrobia bacterium]|nr:hypothetical protein [Candidatus Tectomicrobia bacterium]